MTKPSTDRRDQRILKMLERLDPKEVARKLTMAGHPTTVDQVYHARRRQKDRRGVPRVGAIERRMSF